LLTRLLAIKDGNATAPQ